MHWTWIVTVASIVGTVANIYKKRYCFVIWLGTNLTWMVYDFSIKSYAQAALFGVYAILAVHGLRCWGKECKTEA